MYKKTIFKNGLRLITIPQKNTQAVTILILVGTGSKYETKELNGISHFLEHMYFKGTKKRPSSIEVSETLDRIGGIYNAFTSEEYTGYFAKVAFTHLEIALDWASDIFLNSTLPEKEIEKEKGVIIEEINMRYDHPMSYIQILWQKLLYGDQPAGWDIAGTKESVNNINRKKLIDYMKRQYVASNTIVCVAGRINASLVVKKIKKYFSKIKKFQSLKKSPVIEKQSEPNLLLHTKETDQAHLYLGTRAYNLFHPQKYSQKLLAVILGGMMSSRLFVKIREEMGAAYYISTESVSYPDSGYFTTGAGVDNKKIEKVILAILKEYKNISRKKVPQKELKKAKDCIKGKTALLLESSNVQASFYANQELLEKKILTPEQIFKKIDKVTTTDILKVAKDIFQPQKLNLAIIGPFKNKKRFRKLLKI
ncbi:MAG: M16 family metallopeptidase [Candidatus Nealsonbacteria bacterium]|nr:MAG: insulinase family protein [Candidatus Nealsonbacteria bacterium]